jgi:hypothetical protein
MTQRLHQAIDALRSIGTLPDRQQEYVATEVLELVESVRSAVNEESTLSDRDREPIWERIIRRSSQVPAKLWNALPEDGAAELDHYLYGSPKRLVDQ